MEKVKILLVEDDKNLAFVVKDNLELNGFSVLHCENGEAGLKAVSNELFDLCIFDIMLPLLDGYTLAKKVRERNELIPIIFLTAKSQKEDKIKGFKSGADDYITKPFSIEELLLRIHVFLRRSKVSNTNVDVYQIGAYTFDYKNLLLESAQSSNSLTQKEADILRLFCGSRGQVLKREEILKLIWGDDDYFMGRSLDVFISKLRKYLKEDSSIEIINIHGIGFKMKC